MPHWRAKPVPADVKPEKGCPHCGLAAPILRTDHMGTLAVNAYRCRRMNCGATGPWGASASEAAVGWDRRFEPTPEARLIAEISAPRVVIPGHQWTIRMPGYRPTWLNELLRCKEYRRSRLKFHDAQNIAIGKYQFGVPDATGPRKLTLEIGLCQKQMPDDDAPLKCFLDGCVAAKLILDDDHERCIWDRPNIHWAEKTETIITVEDLMW